MIQKMLMSSGGSGGVTEAKVKEIKSYTCSSEFTGYPFSNALSLQSSNRWASGQNVKANATLRLADGPSVVNAVCFGALGIASSDIPETSCRIEIKGSPNGSDWTYLDTVTLSSSEILATTFKPINNSTAYEYYNINFLDYSYHDTRNTMYTSLNSVAFLELS